MITFPHMYAQRHKKGEGKAPNAEKRKVIARRTAP